MQLEIITQDKGVEINEEVCLLEAEGLEGSFGILNGHIPLIALLKDSSKVKFQTKSTNHMHTVRALKGVLEASTSYLNKQKQSTVKIIASEIITEDKQQKA